MAAANGSDCIALRRPQSTRVNLLTCSDDFSTFLKLVLTDEIDRLYLSAMNCHDWMTRPWMPGLDSQTSTSSADQRNKSVSMLDAGQQAQDHACAIPHAGYSDLEDREHGHAGVCAAGCR